MLTSDAVKAKARDLGFDLCGVAPVGAFPELAALRGWLDRGYAGDMAYMARTADRRADVRAVMPSARSVVALGTLYNTERPYSTEVDDPGTALISRYAWGDDYHDVLAERTGALAEWMRGAHGGGPCETRVYVDTGPVQERVYAQYAGLGWIGKNTCLINPEVGSWLFLSEVLCSAALDPDSPALDQCGTCTLCLEACPTGAFPEPGVLDSTRCLSYLTIEKKTAIPATGAPPSVPTSTAATSARRCARTTRRRRSATTPRGRRGRPSTGLPWSSSGHGPTRGCARPSARGR